MEPMNYQELIPEEYTRDNPAICSCSGQLVDQALFCTSVSDH